jgi:hypothetical protein
MSTKQRKSPKGKFLSSTALHVEPAAEPKTQYGDPAPGQGTARKHQPELAVPPAVTNPRRQGDRGNKDDGAPRLPVFVRYRDLVAAGIVNNWPTLIRLITEQNFPCGILLGPNTRAWRLDEVEAWLAARPIERDEFEIVKCKSAETHAA